MLPRLLSPQFGLLDDGLMLRAVGYVSDDWLAAFTLARGTGRFFPSYFLFYYMVHALVGVHPVLFFGVNCAVFAAITAGLIGLVRLMGGTTFQAWAAGLFFALSGPAVDTFYTLSKPDTPQLLWLVVSLLIAGASARRRNRWARFSGLAATTGALLLADTTKETGLVTVAIAIGWCVIGRRCLDPVHNEAHRAWRTHFALASLLAAAGFMVLRMASGEPSFSQGTYSRLYRLDGVPGLGSMVDALTLLSRDFAYLAPLAGLAVLLRITQPRGHRPLLLDPVVWMCGWVAVYLPWPWVLEYYLLPFAFGAAAFCGVVAGDAIQALRSERRRGIQAAVALSIGAFLVLFPLSLANIATNAAIQLAVDDANYGLVRFISTLPSGSVVSVNMPSPNEYVYEIGLHVKQTERRPDIVVEYFDNAVNETRAGAVGAHVATLVMRHQVVPGVRIPMNEDGAVELGQALTRALGDGREPVFRIRRRVRLIMVNLHRPFCALLGTRTESVYCRWPSPFVDTREFYYGWDVYRQ